VVGPLPVSFTRRADKQIDDAIVWWQRNRTKAPLALSQDVEEALQLISNSPHIGALARNTRLRSVRRVFLHRVGYYLYYRAQGVPPKAIEIVAFWHSRRGSKPRV